MLETTHTGARPEVHLLVVTTNFLNSSGGVESHLRSLLPRLVRRGVVVTVVQLGGGTEPFVSEGVRVLPLRRLLDVGEVVAVPPPGQWCRVVRLARASRLLGGPPVSHVATHTRFFPMSALGLLLGRSLGVPVVHTEHGGGFVAGSGPVVLASRLVDLTMGRWVLRGADVVLAVSRRTAGFVERLAGRSSEPFGNGVDLERWLPDPADAAPTTPPLVYVGRLVEEKGWRTFVEVARRCRAEGWTGEAHLVGDGPDLEEARRVARGVDGLVVHGRLEPPAMRDLLRGGVYVNPSTAAEGFQLTQVEAAAAGAHVVTYDVGVAQELAAAVPGVRVVPSGDVAALVSAVRSALVAPPPGREVEGALATWGWDALTDRYRDVLTTSA